MSERDGKTEKPTAKKLRDARKDGQVAKSQDLSSAISYLVFLLPATFLGSYLLENGMGMMRSFLTEGLAVYTLNEQLNYIGTRAILFVLVLTVPFLAIAFFAGLLANLLQVGFIFSTKSMKPSFGKMNPVKGIQQMVGKKAWFGLVKNLSKLGVVLYLMFLTLRDSFQLILHSSQMGVEKLFPLLLSLIRSLGVKLGIFLLLIGVADYLFQRYDHKKNLMMSQQDIKDEFKQMEGDPQMKSQRKQKYREMLNGKLSDVDFANVVITNPTHFAIAIRYDRSKDAVPMVVTKGQDHMAQKIKERARENKIVIVENKLVARSLYKDVKAGEPVPEKMYQVIAEILAFVYQVEAQQKNKI
ncbi:flagellar biosynthesis protein FlhB [Lacticigenium naphthae]|uniref:flagellar biosynthesis protein FlhB n=1 Tax=Lacticigenium naphthae TaxID=515351 RepID=UPI0003FE71D1|nr:flagellar biosynthesis protein FlhB [Lacticigenium naphthae]